MSDVELGDDPEDFHRRMKMTVKMKTRESRRVEARLPGFSIVAFLSLVPTLLIFMLVRGYLDTTGLIWSWWPYLNVIFLLVYVNTTGLLLISYTICYDKTVRS
jgi:small-conductance mechanosensitive channel